MTSAASPSRRCPSVSVGGLRCQYPEGHQASHGCRGAEWSIGRDSRCTCDPKRPEGRLWYAHQPGCPLPTPDHLAHLQEAVLEAVDALEADAERLRVAQEAFSTGDYETMEDVLRG